MIPYLLGLGAFAAGAWLLNKLTDNEKERQSRLEDNYREYRQASDNEHAQILQRCDETLTHMRERTAHELWLERQRALEARKSRNRKNFDVLISVWQEQFNDREKLFEQIQSTLAVLKDSKDRDQSTELRQTSMQAILHDVYESMARQKAYLRYLDKYKKSATKLFERTGELLEPFQMTLPEFWPYRGKIIGFDRDDLLCGEFEKSIHQRVDSKFFCEDAAQVERLFPDDETIFCLVEDFDDKTFTNRISCVKGMFLHKLELSPNIRLSGKVKRHEQNEFGTPVAYILDADGLEVTLRKKFCRDRRNVAVVGKRKYFYVLNFDRKELKWIQATERIEDCLSVERFRNVPLLIDACDYRDFMDVVKKRNAGESYDEWYVAPLDDEDFFAPKYKCQLGQKLVFRASFTDDEFPKLRFEEFLPDDEMVGANDIFVALDASLRTYYTERAKEIPDEHLQESLNFALYLNAEFAKQRRIKSNRENVLFFNQWCAVMRRLVEVKESGGFEHVEILEQLDDKVFLTNPDCAKRLKHFCRKHGDESNFFVRDLNGKKISVTFDDDCKIIKARDAFDENFLDEVGWQIDVHVREFPYPEIMQAKALDNFRRSQMQRPALKECIFDLSRLTFKDSGRRPRTIKNPSLLHNRNQMLAVIRSVTVENFFMIQGPPGTGKTTVIKEIIWQQLKLEPASKILVVSQANVAVDNVLRGLVPMGISREKIVRCGNDDKISDEMKAFSLDSRIELYAEKLAEPCREDLLPYRKIWRDMLNHTETRALVGECLLKNFSVTGATCVGLEKKNFGLDRLSFNLVVADEAGKALPGELLIPINRAKKIIIIGDHKQLPPVVDPAFFDEKKINISDIVDEESRGNFFATSLFEKLYETCPDENKCMLNIQFRMPASIGEMISNLFYGGRLQSAPTCYRKLPMFFDTNIFFLNMDGDPDYRERQDDTADGKTGPYNEREIEVAAAVLKKLRENFSERVAVITPYKNQNRKLRQKFRAERISNVVVNTVDAFQGDEADAVIYCTTRAKTPTKYFSDAARLNVAFSRARNLLLIIGSLKYFRSYGNKHIMRKVVDELTRRGRVVAVADFFAEDFRTNFTAPTVTENFSDDLTETPLSDSEVESFLPKRDEQDFLSTCRGCGKKFDEAELREGFCADCLFDGEEYKCGNCGREMLYTNAARYVYRQPREELCDDCQIIWRHTCKRCRVKEVVVRARDLKNYPQKTESDFPYCQDCRRKRGEKFPKTCAACEQEFFITRGQVEDLRAQGKTPSEYCRDCRITDISVGTCKKCGRPILFKRAKYHELRSQGKNISEYCFDCASRRREKISMTCSACGQQFFITRGQVDDLRAQGKTPSEYCRDCRTTEISVGSCKICGRSIYISLAEIHRLRKRFGADYAPPRKCKTCR